MRKRNIPYYLLIISTLAGLVLLPFAIVKRSFKDWVIVYLVSIIGNSFADSYLVSKGYLKYDQKLFNKFKIHLPFDYIHYPLMLLYYNQWTLNSRPIGHFFKMLIMVIPQIIIETLAAKKTKLITWKKGWSWYHSFTSLALKLLLCRGIIAMIRVINKGRISV
ncbi:MAG: CBO0543 family protein [Bacillus sp. (in: firmicutes)]